MNAHHLELAKALLVFALPSPAWWSVSCRWSSERRRSGFALFPLVFEWFSGVAPV